MFRIGVISDTHNYLDPKIPRLFSGVDHILHGGDVGRLPIIVGLEAIAPVTAVLGNTDDADLRLKLVEIVRLANRKFLVHHIVNPLAPDESLQNLLAREQPEVVVFGHTHKPFTQSIGRSLFLNPGYAGKSRFGMQRSVAILECSTDEIRPRFLVLED